MRQKVVLIDPDNVDADGLAEAQAVAGAGALTLDGALIVGGSYTSVDGLAHQIGILSAGNDAGITFTIVGTDADNDALSEAVTGSAGAPGTAESTGYFKTVTSITASGAAAGNVSAGTVDEFITNTIQINDHAHDPATISIEDITGTIDVTVQETFSKIHNTSAAYQWYDGPAALTDITAAARDEMTAHASGIRLQGNSFTNTAQLRMVIVQNR